MAEARGAPRRTRPIDRRKIAMLAWLSLALGMLSLLFGVSRWVHRDAAAAAGAAVAATPIAP